MILVDTGPLVALFDPKDEHHAACRSTLEALHAPITTTVPVLTECFHMLEPSSIGSSRLRDFVAMRGLGIWFMNDQSLSRSFELMELYADHPMDLADASLIAAAEDLRTSKVFTIDRGDFSAYRIRRGHKQVKVEIIGPR